MCKVYTNLDYYIKEKYKLNKLKVIIILTKMIFKPKSRSNNLN